MSKQWVYTSSIVLALSFAILDSQAIQTKKANGFTAPDQASIPSFLKAPNILSSYLDPFAMFMATNFTPYTRVTAETQYPDPVRSNHGKEVWITFSTEGHPKAKFLVLADKNEIALEGSSQVLGRAGGRIPASNTPFTEKWDSVTSISTPIDVDPSHFRIQKQNDNVSIIFDKRSNLHSSTDSWLKSLFERHSNYIDNEEVESG